MRPLGFCKVRRLLKQLRGAFANQTEAAGLGFLSTSLVDGPVVLRGCQFVLAVIGTSFDAVSDLHAFVDSDGRDVDANDFDTFVFIAAHHAGAPAAVTNGGGNHSGSTAGYLVNRQTQLAVLAHGQVHKVAVSNLQCGRCRRTHDSRVVPGQLRQRLRHFLKPAVVRETTVVNSIGGQEDDLEIIGVDLCRGFGAFGAKHLGVTADRQLSPVDNQL